MRTSRIPNTEYLPPREGLVGAGTPRKVALSSTKLQIPETGSQEIDSTALPSKVTTSDPNERGRVSLTIGVDA